MVDEATRVTFPVPVTDAAPLTSTVAAEVATMNWNASGVMSDVAVRSILAAVSVAPSMVTAVVAQCVCGSEQDDVGSDGPPVFVSEAVNARLPVPSATL